MAQSKAASKTAKTTEARGEVGSPRDAENPKAAPGGNTPSNQIKDPDEWTTGGEPMTGAQASYLKTLSEQTHEPKAFDPDLDKAEASKRIDALRKEAGRD